MKHLFISIIIVLSFNQVHSQNYDFGKVSEAELQEKYHPKDSSASAAILFREEKIQFNYSKESGFTQERQVHERIKIYNKEGYDWATKKILLYKGGSGKNEKLIDLKGITYNLIAGKIEKEKLRKEGVFEEDYNEFTEIHSLTMPNIKDASVIEFTYKIISPFTQISDIYFQSIIPINKLEISVSTPQFYYYDKIFNPKSIFYPKIKESRTNRSFSTTSIKRSGRAATSSEINYSQSEYYDNTFIISEENIPGIKAESYLGYLDNYLAKMSMELSAVLNENGGIEESFSSSWEKVSKTIYDNNSFGGQLGEFNFYEDDLSDLLANVQDDFHKAYLVEGFVKSKVKWNGNYGKFAQNGIKSAYKDGEGNDADINLLVISMLRSQGVNANPVLISTRNNGIPLFPTIDGFNYVICSVQKENEYLLIDATEQYSTNNVLPQRVLNWQGRLIEEGGVSSWINVLPNKKSVESTMLNVKMNDDLSISGKVAKNLTSYTAYFYREKYAGLSKEDHIKSLETDKGDLEIRELNFENAKDISQPIRINYEYELTDGVDEVGEKLYFSPLLFFAIKENPFKLDGRKYPIDFVIPFEEKHLINIMLPEGYIIESIPQSEAVEFKNTQVKFVYQILQNGNYLQLKVSLEINDPLILPSDYKDFKAFYNKIVEKQSEQVVLTKA